MGNLSNPESSSLRSLDENEDYQLYHIKKSDFTGYVHYDSIFFDDKESIKSLKSYQLSKIKIWYDPNIVFTKRGETLDMKSTREIKITGIETIYKDKRGNCIKSVTHSQKSNSDSNSNLYKTQKEVIELKNYSKTPNSLIGKFYVDMKLKRNEFIIKVIVQNDESGISYMEFITNKFNYLKVGNFQKVSKTSTIYDLKEKVLVGFYGGFLNNTLTYFGIYICLIRNIREILPYFILRKRLKKENIQLHKNTPLNKTNKNYQKLEECDLDKNMADAIRTFLAICNFPDYLFASVIKYL